MNRFGIGMMGVLVVGVSACGSAPVNHAQQVRAALDDARRAAIQRAEPRPLMVLTATAAHLYRAQGKPRTVGLDAPLAQVLETIALSPRLAWWRLSQTPLPTAEQAVQVAADARTLDGLRQHLTDVPAPHRNRAEALLDQTREFLNAQARTGRIDRKALGAFVRRHRALSDQLLQDAAKLRITALHTALAPWHAQLTASEKATLRAVIIDAIDTREGHPTVQYLMGLLNAPGEGERIIFQAGGSVTDALQTAARRALTTDLGIEGYQDPRHLWQSPLAPATRAEIEARPPD